MKSIEEMVRGYFESAQRELQERIAVATEAHNQLMVIKREQDMQIAGGNAESGWLVSATVDDEKIAKLQFKLVQAEAEIIKAEEEIDRNNRHLWSRDDRMAEIKKQFKINEAMHNYQRNKKLESEREKLLVEIERYEDKVYRAEKRLAKARFDREMARRKLEGVA